MFYTLDKFILFPLSLLIAWSVERMMKAVFARRLFSVGSPVRPMYGYLNQVTLIGNVGREPELRVFSETSQVCNFPLATTEFRKNKEGENAGKMVFIMYNMVGWMAWDYGTSCTVSMSMELAWVHCR
jgi:hypothetical protein